MTKKFWKDWQNRIGETKNIYLGTCVFNKNSERWYCYCILSTLYEDKILKTSFYGDAVDLVIERHRYVDGHWHIENEFLTLHRNEIKTIKFIKKL